MSQKTIWFGWQIKMLLKKYIFKQSVEDYFFKIDTANTTVLGYQGNSKKEKHINFIKVPYNEWVFLSSYTASRLYELSFIEKEDHYQYAENVLSYIPKGDVFWYTKLQNR